MKADPGGSHAYYGGAEGGVYKRMTVCDYRHLQGTGTGYRPAQETHHGFQGEEPNAEAALELDFEGFTELLDKTLPVIRNKAWLIL